MLSLIIFLVFHQFLIVQCLPHKITLRWAIDTENTAPGPISNTEDDGITFLTLVLVSVLTVLITIAGCLFLCIYKLRTIIIVLSNLLQRFRSTRNDNVVFINNRSNNLRSECVNTTTRLVEEGQQASASVVQTRLDNVHTLVYTLQVYLALQESEIGVTSLANHISE